MPQKIKDVEPPRGFTRLLFRLPVWLFSAHLGWLLGRRFLLLTHVGRKSGLPRHNVLEVLQYEGTSGSYYVLSGWGEHADWVRNVMQNPDVTIEAGWQRIRASAVRLSAEEGAEKLLFYMRRHPLAARVLPRLMGYTVDGTEDDFKALAQLGLVYAFRPVSPAPAGS